MRKIYYLDTEQLEENGWFLQRQKEYKKGFVITETLRPTDLKSCHEFYCHPQKWVPVTNGRGGHECSNCGSYAPSHQNGEEYLSRHCPDCGALMLGDE